MEGLKSLALYVNLIQKYMEFRGNVSFRIENFEKGNPAKITIKEKTEELKELSPYVLYGNIENDVFSLLNEDGKDMILDYQEEQKLSSKEREQQILAFSKIIKER